MEHKKMKKQKLTIAEWIWIVGLFLVMFFLSTQKGLDYAPDEPMRYDIPKYIFEHHALPNGNMESLRNEIWGFSYAYYPFFLGPLLSAGFMKLVSVFTMNSFALLVAARFTSVLSGVLVAYFVIKIANRLFGTYTKWILIAVTTLIPQFIFLSTYVNNDIIAVAGSAMILYAWLLGMSEKWNLRSCTLLAVGIGVCALSYYNSYGWILCSIFIFFASELWQRRKKLSDKELWKWGIYISIVVLVIISFFFIRNAVLYHGDFLGMSSLTESSEMFAREDIKPSNRPTPQNLGMGFGEMLRTTRYIGINWVEATFESFIAVFSYMTIFAPDWIYNVYKFVLVLGVLGVLLSFLKKVRKKEAESGTVILGINLLICLLIPIGLSMYYSYATDYQPQGRYCYPMLLALTCFISKGLEYLVLWIPSEKIQRTICHILPAVFLGITGYVYLSMYLCVL
ncbi:MAG: glycosyltransferase family 39 protein [Eubacteriales bacterium]|nr:glycosyltransferase family 39 protein [Eubacteriales bacterium]